MASISDHHFYTLFPSDLSGLPVPTTAAAGGAGSALWGAQEDFLVPFCRENVGLVDANNSLLSSSPAESFVSSSSLPEQLGMSDGVVPAFSDYTRSVNMGLPGIGGAQNFGGGSYSSSALNYPQYVNVNGFEFGEECCATSFLPELIKPHVGLVSGQKNWGMRSNQMHGIEGSAMIKVGRYSEEERKERIDRYLKKRNQRNFNKTIKYACRKTLADRRVRVRGRFARNNELNMMCGDHQIESQKINNDPTCKDLEFCCDDAVPVLIYTYTHTSYIHARLNSKFFTTQTLIYKLYIYNSKQQENILRANISIYIHTHMYIRHINIYMLIFSCSII